MNIFVFLSRNVRVGRSNKNSQQNLVRINKNLLNSTKFCWYQQTIVELNKSLLSLTTTCWNKTKISEFLLVLVCHDNISLFSARFCWSQQGFVGLNKVLLVSTSFCWYKQNIIYSLLVLVGLNKNLINFCAVSCWSQQ